MNSAIPPRTRVLVDTDIGSDLDDALALAYLLANDACDLVGITTTTGRPDERARLASILCHQARRDTPIRAGEELTITGRQQQPDVPQAIALQHWAHTPDIGSEGARFIVDEVNTDPGNIVLLCLAPLTTIARAMQLDPELTTKVAGLVIMGGNFGNRPNRPQIEWNFALDADAAEIVYRNAACAIRTVSLDVTHDVALTEIELRDLATRAPLLEPVLDMSAAHFNRYPEVFLHDPLAAATIFAHELCTYDHGTVHIQPTREAQPGLSTFAPSHAGAHEITRDVDAVRFRDHYANVLTVRTHA